MVKYEFLRFSLNTWFLTITKRDLRSLGLASLKVGCVMDTSLTGAAPAEKLRTHLQTD